MIKINQNTKISVIIEHNEKAIDAIACINSDFEKLKNPVLRKIFAKGISIKQAAVVGGVHPAALLHELSKIGFIIEDIEEKISKQ